MVKKLVISALLKRVYWANVDKSGKMMTDDRKDVTDQFLGCVVSFFEPDTTRKLKDVVSGEDTLFIVAKRPDLIKDIEEFLEKRKGNGK